MKVDYAVTFADYKAAVALDMRRKPYRRMLNLWLFIMVPLSCALALIILSRFDPVRFKGLFFGSDGSGYYLVAGLLLPAVHHFVMRREFRSISPPTEPNRSISVDIDDERIVLTIPGSSEEKFRWSTILRFARSEKITLLDVAEDRFMFFPTRALSPAQQSELNSLIERHIVRRKPC